MRFFSIGPNCNPAHQLKEYGYRHEAGPFDWTLLRPCVWAPLISGASGFLDGLARGERGHAVNSSGVEFTHHDAFVPEVAATLQRRLDRLVAAARDGSAVLVAQVNLFGEVAERRAAEHVAAIADLRKYLASVGSTARTETAIRTPAHLDGEAQRAVALLRGSAAGFDRVFRVTVEASNGFDPRGRWDFLNLIAVGA